MTRQEILVAKDSVRKKHRRRREGKPLNGMMVHMEVSHHQWFHDERRYDLIVILDDATPTNADEETGHLMCY